MSVVNVKVANIRPKYNNLEEWMADPNNIYIGRAGVVFINNKRFPPVGSLFANPFKINKEQEREEVIRKYKKYITEKLETDGKFQEEFLLLKNKNLGCWCHPEKCHGDVLLELLETFNPTQ